MFQLCDNDGDGYITESDMAQLCAEDLQTLESVFTYLDKDNDGRVSFDEFLAGFKVQGECNRARAGVQNVTVGVEKGNEEALI